MAAQHCSTTKVLEDDRVSPPPGTVATTSIPTTFLDTFWLFRYLTQRLLFYESPHPTFHFMQNILPILKTSLSLTLQRFFPFAGNLRFPPPPQRPYIFISDGDSIPFLVTESDADFNHLIGNRARHAQELQALVPNLLPQTEFPDGTNVCKQLSLMAIQVTIFPNSGFSIGITFCHAAADGRAFTHFTKSWASACRSQGDKDLAFVDISPPDYNRDSIQDPQGIWSIFLEHNRELTSNFSSYTIQTDNKMRVTCAISQTKVETLKKWIKRRWDIDEKEPLRLSTFVVTCAYIWVCLIKTQESETQSDNHVWVNETDHVDEICNFVFSADCRHRLELPSEYFGNCLQPCLLSAKKAELIGENGILVAAKAIGRAVIELDNGVFKEADKWLSRVMEAFSTSKFNVSVAGSPKLLHYETDFGWGRPIKSEVAHIGSFGSFAIAESRDPELGGVEIGLVLSPFQLHKFSAIFEDGLLNVNIS